MPSQAPSSWRDDLQAALPEVDAAGAVWLGNLNARQPWRTIVAEIRLADGRCVVLKYQTDDAGMTREWAAARLLQELDAPPIAPACLGMDEARRVLVFERLAGIELTEILDGPNARLAWLEAARTVAIFHRWAEGVTSRWREHCPAAAASEGPPVYDLPFDELVAPFVSAGSDAARLSEAVSVARRAYTEPGAWLSFTHSDLQTRHVFWTDAGPRIVDWERAGLRHQLYDLACLLSKPINHGRRLPTWAADAAVAVYSQVRALDPIAVRRELAPVLAYEQLLGVAEYYREEMGPAEARACLEGLITLGDQDPRLAPVIEAAPALRDRLPGEDLPLFAGLISEGIEMI